MGTLAPKADMARIDELRAFRKRHGLGSVLGSALAHVRARWYLRGATAIGTVRLSGRALTKNAGRMRFGDRMRLDGTTVRLEFVCFEGAELSIGAGTYINYGTNISARRSMKIGENCNIGQYCIIMDADYHSLDDHSRPDTPEPVEIGNDVWLGARVIVLKGSKIGDGATIGANSVVRGTIPSGAIAAGNPARVIRMRDAAHDRGAHA